MGCRIRVIRRVAQSRRDRGGSIDGESSLRRVSGDPVAKDAELWRQDPQPDVASKANKLKVWAFEIGGAIEAGKYDLVIRNMKSGGPTNGDTVPAEEWAIEVKVPGPYKDGPQG